MYRINNCYKSLFLIEILFRIWVIAAETELLLSRWIFLFHSLSQCRKNVSSWIYLTQILSCLYFPSSSYFSCSCRRSSNCRARAYIPQGGGHEELVLTKDHSHPPDYMLEKKAEIWKVLKQFAMTLPGKPSQVYNSVVSM